MTDTRPLPEQPGYGYGHAPAPGPQYPGPVAQPAAPARRRPRDGSGTRRTALVIHTIADVAAAFLGLWILLYLLKANQANVFVGFVEDVADALSWWSRDIFTMDTENLRVLLNYGLPAVLYLAVGHGIAMRLRRF
ncbi:hypothetical protein [Streptomyces roseochromogenus]|uniref:Uncharacterized protein n=1 Tax=Streptomyces roseochromogenus subsp. oscitans DS 12.976 TaxID=1352936 RepID=V6KZE0_STRRC|nr:hypothetical protein [Streptomyces roseochromogenus]EST34344.1 hypothetical protein M878_10130 [Streptomyces roseochromogenus subsp. oscitans DS 12.976]